MHPAPSIIIFTTLSGLGYGLAATLGLGLLDPAAISTRLAYLLALALISGGLLSSTLHLGHPERAWRAMSQWRSSWLSREGVLSIATYLPAALFALLWVGLGFVPSIFGMLPLICALATVSATAMIYASLKPVQRWSNRFVLPNYMLLGLATGALWLAMIASLVLPAREFVLAGLDWLAVVAPALAAIGKLLYWRY